MLKEQIDVTIIRAISNARSLAAQTYNKKTIYVEGSYGVGENLTVEIIKEHTDIIICKVIRRNNKSAEPAQQYEDDSPYDQDD